MINLLIRAGLCPWVSHEKPTGDTLHGQVQVRAVARLEHWFLSSAEPLRVEPPQHLTLHW
jgi:hypothetical protein